MLVHIPICLIWQFQFICCILKFLMFWWSLLPKPLLSWPNLLILIPWVWTQSKISTRPLLNTEGSVFIKCEIKTLFLGLDILLVWWLSLNSVMGLFLLISFELGVVGVIVMTGCIDSYKFWIMRLIDPNTLEVVLLLGFVIGWGFAVHWVNLGSNYLWCLPGCIALLELSPKSTLRSFQALSLTLIIINQNLGFKFLIQPLLWPISLNINMIFLDQDWILETGSTHTWPWLIGE